MEFGAVFPHNEIGGDPGAIKAYAQGVEALVSCLTNEFNEMRRIFCFWQGVTGVVTDHSSKPGRMFPS